MVSLNLCSFLLFLALVSFEQVAGVSFKKLTEAKFKALVGSSDIPHTFKNGPITFKLNEPWLIANKNEFYVIIFSCNCKNTALAPCNGKPYFTYVRLWRYDTTNNLFLVMTDEEAQDKRFVDTNRSHVEDAAGHWLDATDRISTELILEAWKLKAEELVKNGIEEGKNLLHKAYEAVSVDNGLPCATAVLGTITFVLLLGPGNSVFTALVDFISTSVA